MIPIGSMLPAEFIHAFAWTLIHSLWQGGLIALLTAGIILLLRNHRPVARYALLCVLMALLPIMFAATFLFYYNQDRTVNQHFYPAGMEQQGQEIAAVQAGAESMPGKNAHEWLLIPSKLIDNQANLLVLIWFIGFFFFLFRFTGSLLYVYRLKNRQIFPVDKRWEANLRKLSSSIGLKRSVALAESALANIPLTIGYLKPVILLPLGTLSGVPPQQIDAILLHELAHILRKDYMVNILQSIVEILFFYHPAVWWLSGLIRQEREHICDDIAISINEDHINYIKALTTMEELSSKSPLLAHAVTGSRKKLLCRVKRLISPNKFRKGAGEGIIVFIIIIGLVSAFSLNALSVVPDSFDLTGRESGGKVYNLLPFNTFNPDTIKAVSKSGNVTISVYTDSVNEVQQKALQEVAESIDKKDANYIRKEEHHIVRVERPGAPGPIQREERKVVVITKGDSTNWESDSVIVMYDDEIGTGHAYHYEYRIPRECPVPPDVPEYSYFYSYPELPEGEELRVKVFRFSNDSIDTLIFMNPGTGLSQDDLIEMEWNEQEMQDLMKDQQMDLMELLNPPIAPGSDFGHESRIEQSELILRQELRDDGLTERGRKYVIEIDSKSMYINGEKQPKEIYRKYRKLVESTEQVNFEGDEIFKMIF